MTASDLLPWRGPPKKERRRVVAGRRSVILRIDDALATCKILIDNNTVA
jgi:hypothetical protein